MSQLFKPRADAIFRFVLWCVGSADGLLDMPPVKASAAEVATLRGLLALSGGRASWQALEHVAGSAEFRAFLKARHPSLGGLVGGTGRRRTLGVMASASIA
jgi:hypothetical protein